MTAVKSIHIPFAYSLEGVQELPVSGAKHPLQREAQRWVLVSGSAAIVIGLSLFSVWQWWMHREPEVPVATEVRIVRYQDLGVPPSISRTSSSQVNVAQAMAAPPEIVVPEPVPDEQAAVRTIMTQSQISDVLTQITNSDLGGDFGGDIQVADMPKYSDLQPSRWAGSVDQLPVRLSMNRPEYPEMARLAEVEGTVTLHILVGKDGRVKEVRYVDGPTMLKDAAIKAAKSALFKPAMIDKRPVEVWVAIPIAFQMQK